MIELTPDEHKILIDAIQDSATVVHKGRKDMNENSQLDPIAEFLAKGGKIQQIASGVSGRVEGAPTSAWGAPRKAGRPAQADVAPVTEEDDDE